MLKRKDVACCTSAIMFIVGMFVRENPDSDASMLVVGMFVRESPDSDASMCFL